MNVELLEFYTEFSGFIWAFKLSNSASTSIQRLFASPLHLSTLLQSLVFLLIQKLLVIRDITRDHYVEAVLIDSHPKLLQLIMSAVLKAFEGSASLPHPPKSPYKILFLVSDEVGFTCGKLMSLQRIQSPRCHPTAATHI